ncbi:MAG: DUF4423 domain-containing protein [Myxococcales bacterium]|nr:DUF4423 domain-containing protein [Myxococcales bacterium]MDD9965238.1 DUF4423 domain-containing protein [Myxococcales bacterium]
MRHADAEMVAADLLRVLRGRRSRPDFSRRLGFRSNVALRWECGLSWPAADDFVRALSRVQPDAATLFARFMGWRPDTTRPPSAAEVAAFLREQRGKVPIRTLVERTGYNRYQIGRWLSGRTRPRLPEFLCLVEAASRRLLDLLACLVDPARMPTVAPRWRALCAARAAAYEAPWSHAVLRALEVERPGGRESIPRLARRIGLTEELVAEGLAKLVETGQVRKARGRHRVQRVQAVDTRAESERGPALKAYWGRMAIQRLERGTAAGQFGYSLFAVSHADMQRLKQLQLDYVRAMQSIIAESTEPECVGLYCSQLLDLRAI